MKNKNITEKIGYLFYVIVKEYILGTSIYLMSLFTLHINKSINAINLVFWIIMINLIFEKFILRNAKSTKDTYKYLNIIIRIIFIGINILGFGLNIFSF